MTTPTSTFKPLGFNEGPLVWIDCEMTGLDPKRHRLLEIAVIITDGDLQPVDDGIQYVIKVDSKDLDLMDEWCTTQHGSSGLTQASLWSKNSLAFVSSSVLAYIKKWIPVQRTGVLAGNSVHVDKTFLVEEMPEVVDWLHYRIVDVSSIKELCRRWYPPYHQPPKLPPGREIAHRALADIMGSIQELKWYRENIFVPPSGVPTPGSR
ncbi:ribonuclease H-like protein [Sistotremastrum niveocremeum HHB9708]|uniref:Ribonuclease H-like protein n=1 Tax=Sistotremastrum niveocremeum HHB9708 TaxID=1314777 RepID=A0A164P150_9AGAM|nr:ribonuclease H-like protein [Sistotremastrum niveocremeum HHB9708]